MREREREREKEKEITFAILIKCVIILARFSKRLQTNISF
jgi:hypothetical protein